MGTARRPRPQGGRRRLLKGVGWTVIGLAAGRGAAAGIARLARNRGAVTPPQQTATPEITPNEQFYTISKNFLDPVVKETGWKLTVTGLVDKPLELDYRFPQGVAFREGDGHTGVHKQRGRRQPHQQRRLDGGPAPRPAGCGRRQGHGQDRGRLCRGRLLGQLPRCEGAQPGIVLAYRLNGEPWTSTASRRRLVVPGIYGMKKCEMADEGADDWDYRGTGSSAAGAMWLPSRQCPH